MYARIFLLEVKIMKKHSQASVFKDTISNNEHDNLIEE